MIVKKLRDRRGWTQEQLAECCGLNVRTIQRVESGNKASLETLQSLASVFEVDVSTLTEEITVIDKKSEDWKDLPWWFRANMFGIYTKRTVVWVELALVVAGVLSWIFLQDTSNAAIMFLGAYITGWIVRYGDKKTSLVDPLKELKPGQKIGFWSGFVLTASYSCIIKLF
jgi:transcriptional regulator with XRE-family HTH domain